MQRSAGSSATRPIRSEIDLFLIKTLPGTIVDRQAYDFILYLDSDMLVHAPLESIFAHRTVVADFNGRKALRDVKRLAKHFTAEERVARGESQWRGRRGASASRPIATRFYERYRETYLKHLHEIPHDQPALSFAAIRYHAEFPVATLPNRAYWRHYWGYRKRELLADYEAKYRGACDAALERFGVK